MIYILNGDEEYLIEKKINDILNENKDSEILRFNGLDKTFEVKTLLEILNNVGLFANRKLILIKDPYFFIKKSDDNFDELIKYCTNPFFENDLVFYTLENTFNEKLKLFKDIIKNAQHIKYSKLKKNDFYNECCSILNKKNIKLKRELLNMLIDSCNNSLKIFSLNVDLIELYPDELTLEVLENLLISDNNDNVYQLINALTNKNISLSFRLIKKYLAYDNNINGLVSLLGSQLRFLYEVSYYSSNSLSINEIMDKVNTSSRYRIEKAFETLRFLKSKEILILLNKLSDLDYTLKNNYDLDSELQFELFVVGLLGVKNA